jgi:hypothetical protein
MIEEGYAGVEGLGGGGQAVREDEGNLPKTKNRAAGARFRLTERE